MADFPNREYRCTMTPEKKIAVTWIRESRMTYETIAKDLWDHPELSLAEFKSSTRLEKYLEENGFKIEKGVPGMPTAFIATWGAGQPVIGFLAEYDALPNLSQKSQVLEPDPVIAGAPGQGCGHNLLGTSICTAAIAIKVALEKSGMNGTIRVFGTPAEETLIGKVYMARENVFAGTDMMIAWHPEDTNGVDYKSMLAMTSVKFQFMGISTHGGSAPELGRSALEAVELMDVGMNYMRGHLIQDARINYVITKGGEVPNNVPPIAEVWYFIRAPRRFQVDQIWNWMLDVAKGASLMTQTSMKPHLLSATWELLPNKSLARVGDENATLIGAPDFTAEDQKFGEEIIRSLGRKIQGPAFDNTLTHPDLNRTFPNVDFSKASTDLGNVSWIFPTLSFRVATKALGTPQHSWQMVCQTNSPPAMKAGLRVSEWMAASALDCFARPELIEEAWEEHRLYLQETKFYHPVPEDLAVPTFRDLYGVGLETVCSPCGKD
jgi:aminobenzoyl-glutamate utilization protein B